MAEHGALATLKDLAEKEVEDAARLLGEMRRGCQQAEEQLKMLIDYQNEYRNNLNSDMSAGMTSNRWINYQQFIQTLEKAITQHRQQLNQWTQKVDIALNSWREKKLAVYAGCALLARTGCLCRKRSGCQLDYRDLSTIVRQTPNHTWPGRWAKRCAFTGGNGLRGDCERAKP